MRIFLFHQLIQILWSRCCALLIAMYHCNKKFSSSSHWCGSMKDRIKRLGTFLEEQNSINVSRPKWQNFPETLYQDWTVCDVLLYSEFEGANFWNHYPWKGSRKKLYNEQINQNFLMDAMIFNWITEQSAVWFEIILSGLMRKSMAIKIWLSVWLSS